MKKSVKSKNQCQSVIQTNYVKTHGGEIKVESITANGTEFTIVLPA